MKSKKVKVFIWLISFIGVVIVVTMLALNYSINKKIEAGKISSNEIPSSKNILREHDMSDRLINTLTDSQKYYIAQNLNPDAKFRSCKTFTVKPAFLHETVEENDMAFTVCVFFVNIDGVEKSQIFTCFTCPDTHWGVDGDRFRVSLDCDWQFDNAYDITMTMYLENSETVSESTSYLTSHLQPADFNNNISAEYGFDIPPDKEKGISGYTYSGCTMAYATMENPEETDLSLNCTYTHDDSVVYTKGVVFNLK